MPHCTFIRVKTGQLVEIRLYRLQSLKQQVLDVRPLIPHEGLLPMAFDEPAIRDGEMGAVVVTICKRTL